MVTELKYYSQFEEDRILASLFSHKKNGFCIEVGANDGVNDSNTFYFEGAGWECLLIEPNPELCAQIRSSRSSTLIECAASDTAGQVSLLVAEGSPRAHGVSTIINDSDAQQKIRSYGFSFREISVSARTLDDILDENYRDRPIDFVSIDVEGNELAVLRGFSLNRWRPTILLVEDNSNYEDSTIKNYLRDYNYVPFFRTGVNDWYAAVDNRALTGWVRRSVYSFGRAKSLARGQLRKVPAFRRLHYVIRRFFS